MHRRRCRSVVAYRVGGDTDRHPPLLWKRRASSCLCSGRYANPQAAVLPPVYEQIAGCADDDL